MAGWARPGLWAAAVLAFAAGCMAGAVPGTWDADLVPVLRFMAAVKALMALGALLLIDWRFRRLVGARAAFGYGVGAALMAASPGLIWGMAHIVAGAVVFHAGLLLGVIVGWRDSVIGRSQVWAGRGLAGAGRLPGRAVPSR